MKRLEAWSATELIEILISEPALDELVAAHDPNLTRKGISYIQTLTRVTSPDEIAVLKTIEGIVFPRGATTASHRSDVEIIFNAHKYGARLVTADGASKRQPGGILGAALALRAFGVEVLTDEQACALVEREIQGRDERARQWARQTSQPLPAWLGKDL